MSRAYPSRSRQVGRGSQSASSARNGSTSSVLPKLIRRGSRWFASLLVALSAISCGDSPTGPSSGTRIEAVVQDSPASGSAATGTLAGNVHASVGTSDRWIDIGSPNGITIPLQTAGRTTTVHGQASVASGTYTRVRLVLQGVTARLASGSNVGGTVQTSERTVVLGGSDERVEISVPVSSFSIEVSTGVRHVITFHLRSQQWLNAAAVQAGRVDDAAIQAAATGTVRTENR